MCGGEFLAITSGELGSANKGVNIYPAFGCMCLPHCSKSPGVPPLIPPVLHLSISASARVPVNYPSYWTPSSPIIRYICYFSLSLKPGSFIHSLTMYPHKPPHYAAVMITTRGRNKLGDAGGRHGWLGLLKPLLKRKKIPGRHIFQYIRTLCILGMILGHQIPYFWALLSFLG